MKSVKMHATRNNVYTPGSVDSWDMENVQFLHKIRRRGGKNGRQDLDAVSYVSTTSDAESAIYEDRTIVGDLTSEDEKGRHAASIYGRRGDQQPSSSSFEDDSLFGMSSSTTGSTTVQSPTRLLDEALYSGGNGFALLNKSIVMKQMKSMAASTLKDPYLEDEVSGGSVEPIIEATTVVRRNPLLSVGALSRKSSRSDDQIFDRRMMKNRKPKPSLVAAGFMEPPLEDCYVLDVMTIRNESVLAEKGRGRRERTPLVFSDSQDSSESDGLEKALKINGSKKRNGSTGLPSSSSSSSVSSSDEFNSAREGSFFPAQPEVDDPIEIHRDSSPEGTRASSCSPVSVVVRGECTSTSTRFPGGAGGITQSSDRSFATATSSNNYYYLGQQGPLPQEDFESNDDDYITRRDSSKESLEMLETPRSPSPYYVRLRRDLIPPSLSPTYRQPWNFGMNGQGLLVIDYSSNWIGLENYVRSLSLHQ